jgi:DNA repair protein RadC
MAYIPSVPTPGSRRLIRDLPKAEQPLYRLSRCGTNGLSNAELLALIFGSGDGLDLAQELLTHFGSLHQLARAGEAQLTRMRGIGPAQAARLLATLELSRRLQAPPAEERYRITSPADAANLLMPGMRDLEQEELWVIVLDTRNRVLKVHTVYKGNLNSAIIRITEVFRPAIELQGAAIIVAHNHPSNDVTPSPEDLTVTRQIIQAGKLLDIDALDHLIIGAGRYVSLKERGLIDS